MIHRSKERGTSTFKFRKNLFNTGFEWLISHWSQLYLKWFWVYWMVFQVKEFYTRVFGQNSIRKMETCSRDKYGTSEEYRLRFCSRRICAIMAVDNTRASNIRLLYIIDLHVVSFSRRSNSGYNGNTCHWNHVPCT